MVGPRVGRKVSADSYRCERRRIISASLAAPPLGEYLEFLLKWYWPIVIINQLSQGQTSAELNANLLDIHNQRLAHMDATQVDFVSFPLFFGDGRNNNLERSDGSLLCFTLHSRHIGSFHS